MKYITLVMMLLVSVLLVGCMPKGNEEIIEVIDPTPQEEEVQEAELVEEVEDEAMPALNLSMIEISANGTEPFWHFAASGTNLTWHEPSMSGPMTTTTHTIAMSQSGTTVMLSGASVSATLVLQPCSDGMSDIVYGYMATVVSTQTYNGCANISL